MSIKQGSNYIAGGGGQANIDNKSITKNSSDQLQTIGVINQNDTTTVLKTWTGTKAQYDAIVTKDPNTLYNITDDTDVSLTILEALYPVGSIYITTANTCPLSSLITGSTWALVSSGRVLQGADVNHTVGTTIEAGLPNITGSLAISSAQGFRNEVGVFSGAFKNGDALSASSGGEALAGCKADFDASLSNSIYGNSTTVQPPAYYVNIFERTA